MVNDLENQLKCLSVTELYSFDKDRSGQKLKDTQQRKDEVKNQLIMDGIYV